MDSARSQVVEALGCFSCSERVPAAGDALTAVSHCACLTSTCLTCALFDLALLQVIVISVSGQSDTVQKPDQNNTAVSKQKKMTTSSKRKDGEKKGKSTFIFVAPHRHENW